MDYRVPPGLAGHFCLFVRPFSFAPRDLPISDNALDPAIERHVAQQNLTILVAASTLTLDVIHFPDANDLIQQTPVTATGPRQIRHEAATHLRPVSSRQAAKFIGGFGLDFQPPKNDQIRDARERQKDEQILICRSDKHASAKDGAGLMNQMQAVQVQMAKGRRGQARFRELTPSCRDVTTSQTRGHLQISRPKIRLKPDHAAAYHLRRTDRLTGRVTGGFCPIVMGEAGSARSEVHHLPALRGQAVDAQCQQIAPLQKDQRLHPYSAPGAPQRPRENGSSALHSTTAHDRQHLQTPDRGRDHRRRQARHHPYVRGLGSDDRPLHDPHQ